MLNVWLPMPDATDLTLDAVIRRANQYRHKAVELRDVDPVVSASYDWMADFVIEGMNEESHG